MMLGLLLPCVAHAFEGDPEGAGWRELGKLASAGANAAVSGAVAGSPAAEDRNDINPYVAARFHGLTKRACKFETAVPISVDSTFTAIHYQPGQGKYTEAEFKAENTYQALGLVKLSKTSIYQHPRFPYRSVSTWENENLLVINERGEMDHLWTGTLTLASRLKIKFAQCQ